MTARPALLTKELESAMAKLRSIVDWHSGLMQPQDTFDEHEANALLQHIAALEQRVALLERHNGVLRDWCRDPAEVRKIIESALPKEPR